ncbi:TonB-dependent receptor [Methylocystis sp. 9N]|uniref:TonB-dependent receptor n=1 Tax=Methylocystis borbori TaxID=3118750 RepID=A0ABU7XCV0_9HYPH
MGSSDYALRKRLLSSVRFAPLALMGGVAAGLLSAERCALAEDAQPAAAAAASAQVEDVKVTARQREEKAQDVPLPVSVVGPKTQERERLERMQDFAQKVPNFIPSINNPRTSAMSIRGISGISGGADGSESAVGLIVDNVFYTHVGFQWADFVDLQSFEVARGPQGTLLGKNTTVGAVVIRTQLPSFVRSATYEQIFGNYNRFIEKLNVTGPIIDDKLAGRVTFYFDKGDGWIQNQFNGQKLLDNNRWGVRGQLLYVGDNFTDRLIFDRLRSDEYNNYGNGAIGDSFPLWANGAPARLYSQNLASRLHWPVFSFDPYKPYLTRLGKLDQRTHGLSNEINYTIGENTLTAVSAWREFVLHPRNSTGNNLTDISSNAYDVYVDQYSHETRLASPSGQTLEWTVGNYNLYEKIWSYNHVDYGSQANQWFQNNFNASPYGLWGLEYRNDGKARTFSTALFAQATWHIDEQWALTFGLRDTFEIRGGSDFGWIKGISSVNQIAAVKTATGGTSYFDTGGQEKSNNSLSGLLNPSYRYNENVMVYSSVARGEKSGAINTQALPILDSAGNFKAWQPLITKPETSWDYELGAKTNWLDGKLILNANFYWNDIYNFQSILVNTDYTDVTGVPLRKNFLGNIGHVRLRGFEWDGRWSPIERLWLTFSGALTEARYIDYAKAAPPQEWTWPAAANAGGVGIFAGLPAPGYISLSGMPITGGVSGNNPVPRVSFNVGYNHEYPLGAIFSDFGPSYQVPVTLFSYANATWRDKTQLSSPVSIYPIFQPAYALVNAGVGLKTEDETYSANLWVRNLLDERVVVTEAFGSPTAASTLTFAADNPRTYGVTLRVKLY